MSVNKMVIAGTGHRPQYLYGGYTNEGIEYLVKIATMKLEELRPEKAIQGGALGWDTALGIAAIRLGIPLISAIPFKGQELRWAPESIKIFNRLLDKSEEVVVVCNSYSKQAYLERDRWMVDNADEIVALYNGINKGGTSHTIDYASKMSKLVHNCWNLYLENLPQ